MTKISVIISSLAFILSCVATYVAYLAWLDSRKLAGLYLSPEFDLVESFQNSPPSFKVYNRGPVEAIYFEAEQVLHFYQDGKIAHSQGQGENRYKADKFNPQKKVSIIFDKTLLSNAKLQKPPEHNVLEVRLLYRRQSDKKLFRKSAFFFTNPKGSWVGEYDDTLIPSTYEPIKVALIKSAKAWAQIAPSGQPAWFPLHSIGPDE